MMNKKDKIRKLKRRQYHNKENHDNHIDVNKLITERYEDIFILKKAIAFLIKEGRGQDGYYSIKALYNLQKAIMFTHSHFYGRLDWVIHKTLEMKEVEAICDAMGDLGDCIDVIKENVIALTISEYSDMLNESIILHEKRMEMILNSVHNDEYDNELYYGYHISQK